MKQITFSIIIPIFNAEKHLDRCLESIYAQTYQNFEIILINDGSIDKSMVICEKYKKLYNNICIINETNKGVSHARNIGLQYAKNTYIYFIDSDDYIEKNTLQTFKNYILKTNSDLIVCGFINEYKNYQGKIFLEDRLYNKQDIIKEQITLWQSGLLFNIWNKVFKKELILNNKIKFPNYNYGEDLKFVQDYLLKCNNLYIINKCLYHYVRENKQSITNSYVENLFEFRIKELKVFTSYFNKLGINKTIYNDFLTNRFIIRIFDSIEKISSNSCHYSLKTKYIKIKQLINHKETIERLKIYNNKNLTIKIMLLPIKLKLPIISLILGYILHIYKKCFPKKFYKQKNIYH